MKNQFINIGFENLKVHTIVGLLAFERKVPQTLLLTLEAKILSSQVGGEVNTDTIGKIPNYFELAIESRSFIQQGKFQTLETLINKLSSHLMTQHDIIQEISLIAKKPSAIPHADAAVVSQTFFKIIQKYH